MAHKNNTPSNPRTPPHMTLQTHMSCGSTIVHTMNHIRDSHITRLGSDWDRHAVTESDEMTRLTDEQIPATNGQKSFLSPGTSRTTSTFAWRRTRWACPRSLRYSLLSRVHNMSFSGHESRPSRYEAAAATTVLSTRLPTCKRTGNKHACSFRYLSFGDVRVQYFPLRCTIVRIDYVYERSYPLMESLKSIMYTQLTRKLPWKIR